MYKSHTPDDITRANFLQLLNQLPQSDDMCELLDTLTLINNTIIAVDKLISNSSTHDDIT